MALIRWEPAREIDSLQTEMNRLFSSFLEPGQSSATSRSWGPAMDVGESEEHYILTADLPGMSQDDVAIELDGEALTISGARPARAEGDGYRFFRLERPSGTFQRTLTLPAGVDADAVTATFADGVLEVRIPKPERHRPRKVQISVGKAPPLVEA
jgi:HSP20 family protein